VPINSVPVDQTAFAKCMIVAIEPKNDRETGIQFTDRDGTKRKWSAQVVISMPSRWEAGKTESEVVAVTLTIADDPTGLVKDGDAVWFDGLSVGVMNPEQGDNGRIRGGRLFWQASGIHVRQSAGAGKRAE